MQADLFTPERLAAGAAKVRQGARDRVAEQRATVARDYAAEWLEFVRTRPAAVDTIVAAARALAEGTTGYIAENTVRAIKLKGFGVEASIGDAPEAAQAVATAAQDEADTIKENG